MGFADNYLLKQKYFNIPEAPSGLLRFIVIIPAYCEPDVLKTMESLKQCHKPTIHAEVFVLFNYSEDALQENKEQTQLQFNQAQKWVEENQLKWIKFNILKAFDLPAKFAGVGLARKILMDTAVNRFNEYTIQNGIIISLDADTLVPNDYFTALENEIKVNPDANCILYNFEHDVHGDKYSSDIYKAAVLYELHLRYLKQILQSTGYPYFQYTIGSCFAVPVSIYVKVGGMNKNKAGEDFYFLQKVFPFGNIRFLKNTCVKPSSRPSWRVPFGTGAAIQKIINSPSLDYNTYHPEQFDALKKFEALCKSFYQGEKEQIKTSISSLPSYFISFLEQNKFYEKISEINNNSSSLQSFIKRFYSWFNAFMVIKYLNYSRIQLTSEITICQAVCVFLNIREDSGAEKLLSILRERDKES